MSNTLVSTYETRLRKTFDLDKIGQAYILRGKLDKVAFEKAFKDTVRIRLLNLEGLEWLLFDHMLSVHQTVPLLDHYEALSAGMGTPFLGISEFYGRLIELELLPPAVLNRTIFHRVPTEPLLLGELLVRLGLLTEATLQRALGIQSIILDKTGVKVAIGQIFRSVGHLSIVDFFQVIGVQVGVPFVGLNESAPAIYQAVMTRRVPQKNS